MLGVPGQWRLAEDHQSINGYARRERLIARLSNVAPSIVRAVTRDIYGASLGGKWRACIEHEAFGQSWMGGQYREIERDRRIVYTFAWEGQGGQPTRETLIAITFHELPDGKTRMNFHQAFFESIGQRDGHNQGWISSFDRLADFVKQSYGRLRGEIS